MPRPLNPTEVTRARVALILETIGKQGFENFEKFYEWQYDKAALRAAVSALGVVNPSSKASRADLLEALRTSHEARSRAEGAPSSVPLPSYRPWVARYEDGRVSETSQAPQQDCKCFGMSGPCWGQVDFYEVRHMLTPGGRCLEARCQGHKGARYVPSTEPL